MKNILKVVVEFWRLPQQLTLNLILFKSSKLKSGREE